MNSKIHTIHMVGIGGAGMCGIAEILLNQGYSITGSDVSDSPVIKHLRKLGAKISIGHDKNNVGDVQVVIKSTAIAKDNPELLEAAQNGIPVIPRAEMLAELMRLKHGIAIAGTHGKTTTTSLTAAIFDSAGLDPTVVIGGRVNLYGTNAHLGYGEYLIAEADESDGSFLRLFPFITAVTNVDEDHLDYYQSRDKLDAAFIKFMNNVPFYGQNIVCGDDHGVQQLLPYIKRPYTTYGFGDKNRLRATLLEEDRSNHFAVFKDDKLLGEVTLPQPGTHNVLNSLAAIGIAMSADIPFEKCIAGLESFKGVCRRFEFKGEKSGITVIDDYGHHPTEITATLQTARKVFPGRRLVTAFQPHRFSRTQAHFGEFCKIFELADLLLLTEIYASSENPIPGISGQSLAQGIRQVCSTPIKYFETLDELLASLDTILKPGDVLLTQGAGSITRIGPAWLNGAFNA